jgi:hypothetical protein
LPDINSGKYARSSKLLLVRLIAQQNNSRREGFGLDEV